MSMNIIFVAGRLATDPTLSTVNDTPCTSFTLASDTRSKDANGNFIPIFYRVSVWRRMAETTAQYLHKGDSITVTGDLSLRTYVDREGQNRTSVQITANHIEFPSRKNSAPQVPAVSGAPSSDDELPF